jgi:hypothetical protein
LMRLSSIRPGDWTRLLWCGFGHGAGV